eukprot:6180665-Pleurochrysis_carterae.AAC.6
MACVPNRDMEVRRLLQKGGELEVPGENHQQERQKQNAKCGDTWVELWCRSGCVSQESQPETKQQKAGRWASGQVIALTLFHFARKGGRNKKAAPMTLHTRLCTHPRALNGIHGTYPPFPEHGHATSSM